MRPGPGAVTIDQGYMIGSPAEIIAQVDGLTKELPVTDLMSWGTPPRMDPADFNPRLERFAREVMPHFR